MQKKFSATKLFKCRHHDVCKAIGKWYSKKLKNNPYDCCFSGDNVNDNNENERIAMKTIELIIL